MAITGPFTRTTPGKYRYKYQQWYRQGKPYVAPLPYKVMARSYTWGGNLSDSGAAGNAAYDYFSNPAFAYANAEAYADFKEKLGEVAQLAASVAERKRTIDTIAKRTTQLFNFTRSLKRGRFGEAAEALGLRVVNQSRTSVRVKRSEASKRSSWSRAREAERQRQKDRGSLPEDAPVSGQYRKRTKPQYHQEDDSWEIPLKRGTKALGSNWLEFHFGWEPLVKEIEAAVEIFTDPLRGKTGELVVGRGKYGGIKTQTGNPNVLFSISSQATWGASVVIRARVKVNDPDLHRAEQLGLLNPIATLWELVPFSFVVDWFTNVGDYLASMTDFAGLDLQYPSTSTQGKVKEVETYLYHSGPLLVGTYDTFTLERKVGITGPTIVVPRLKTPSVIRGVTAVSLLTGLLKSV